MVFPLVLRFLLDAAFEQKDRTALDRVALMLLGVFGVQALMNFVQVFLLSSTTERVVATLREKTKHDSAQNLTSHMVSPVGTDHAPKET